MLKIVQKYWRKHPTQRRIFAVILLPVALLLSILTIIFMVVRAGWLEFDDESRYQAKWIWGILSE